MKVLCTNQNQVSLNKKQELPDIFFLVFFITHKVRNINSEYLGFSPVLTECAMRRGFVTGNRTVLRAIFGF